MGAEVSVTGLDHIVLACADVERTLNWYLEEGGPSAGRLDHLCLTVEPVDLAAVSESGGFEVVNGPVPRFGARGVATSPYVRDPDGTVVELGYY